MMHRPQSSVGRRSQTLCQRLLTRVVFIMLVSCVFGRATQLLGRSLSIPVVSAFASITTLGGRMTPPTRVLHSTEKSDDEKRPKQPHIVVLGGGFGGINTALTLPTLPWSDAKDSSGESIKPKITLIDKSERFVFLPLLYELCVEDASLDEVAPTFKTLLDGADGGSGFASLSGGLPDLSQALRLFSGEQEKNSSDNGCEVSFLQAQVEGIDAPNQQVVIKSAGDGIVETMNYDALVIATGAEISLDAIHGASEYALPFYTVEQALELKRRLALLDTCLDDDGGSKEGPVNVVVVGGGYSGVELALNLVDRFGSGANDDVQVSLVHRGKQVLEYATEHNRKTGQDRLKSAGVNVMTSTSVEEVLPFEACDDMEMTHLKKSCVLKVSTKSDDDSREEETALLPTTLLLWTAGATPTSERNTGVRNSILPRDAMGRILTSSTLNIPEFPNIFAVGDCGRPKKVPYPGTAQVALQQATVAAWNVYATLIYGSTGKKSSVPQGSKLLPFNFLNLGEMMTLGTDDATISTLGGRVELSGPAASWLRRWIYAVRMPTPKQGLVAAVDGTGRKLARSAASSRRRKSKPVDWK